MKSSDILSTPSVSMIESVSAETSSIKLIPSEDEKCQTLFTYFPISYWLPRYQFKSHFADDIIAGLTAGVMVIPQGMGYSLIAGLDPIYGLYGSMFGPLLYSLFGTSGQLSVAPVAIVSLMTGEALEAQLHDLEFENDEQLNDAKIGIASAIAFQVGIIMIFIGLLRGGLIANLLSHSVILGFTCAAAILIAFSQIKYIFGIDMIRGEFIEMIVDFIKNVDETHWQTFVMSMCCIAFLLFINFWKKRVKWVQFIPAPLIVIIVTTVSVYATDNTAGFDIIGDISNGLPVAVNFFNTIPSMNVFWGLWTVSLMIALIAFIESYAVANKFAEKRDYHINASQELIANGIPNLFGSFFTIYPVTGGLSRTAVVDAANGHTPLNSLICGVFMIIALSLLLFLFEYLPKCALAAIIMVSVYNLFDYKGLIHLYQIKKKDFYVAIITFIITLFLGVEIGVAVGIITSIIMFIQRATMPHYAVLGQIDDAIYRNIKNYENAVVRDDMLIIRWDASLFFGNLHVFKSKINKQIKRRIIKEKKWCLVLCFTGINDIDATAAEGLHVYFKELTKKYDNLSIILTNIKKPVKIVLEKTNVIQLIGENKIFLEIDKAQLWWDNFIKVKAQQIMEQVTDHNNDDDVNKVLLNIDEKNDSNVCDE